MMLLTSVGFYFRYRERMERVHSFAIGTGRNQGSSALGLFRFKRHTLKGRHEDGEERGRVVVGKADWSRLKVWEWAMEKNGGGMTM